MMGNYMNGTNFAGGAFGFKIASINRLVDTKSSNGQNLLHFVERVVTQHFPEVQGFMDELAKPAEANRVSFTDMQSTSKKMLDDIRAIRRSLQNNFTDVNDGYARKMFRFSAVAEEEMQEVRDGILQAEKHLRDVQTYYGEGEEMGRPLQSQDFFGIFRTFTSSWKVSDSYSYICWMSYSYQFCRNQNRARQEEAASREKRAQARAALTPQTTGASENNLIDARMQRLRLEGTPRVKREKRRPAPPLSPLPASTDYTEFMLPSQGDLDYGTLAQKMMDNIFSIGSPSSPQTPHTPHTPHTPGEPHTPGTPHTPGVERELDTPRTPHTPHTPHTPGGDSPETPEGVANGGVAVSEGGAYDDAEGMAPRSLDKSGGGKAEDRDNNTIDLADSTEDERETTVEYLPPASGAFDIPQVSEASALDAERSPESGLSPVSPTPLSGRSTQLGKGLPPILSSAVSSSAPTSETSPTAEGPVSSLSPNRPQSTGPGSRIVSYEYLNAQDLGAITELIEYGDADEEVLADSVRVSVQPPAGGEREE